MDDDRWFDDKLRLALLDAVVWRNGGYDALRPAYEAFAHGKPAPRWASFREDDDHGYWPFVESFFLAQPLDARALGALERLTLDGDSEIYGMIFPDWWHYGDHFMIRDLRDLARCPALQYLSLGGVVGPCSLAPLEDLPMLRELSVCAATGYTDVEILAELPLLERLDAVNVGGDRVWRTAIDAVTARAASRR